MISEMELKFLNKAYVESLLHSVQLAHMLTTGQDLPTGTLNVKDLHGHLYELPPKYAKA